MYEIDPWLQDEIKMKQKIKRDLFLESVLTIGSVSFFLVFSITWLIIY